MSPYNKANLFTKVPYMSQRIYVNIYHYVYMCIYVTTYICVYMSLRIYVYVWRNEYTCSHNVYVKCIYICVYMYIWVYGLGMYICQNVNVCIYVYMYPCIYVTRYIRHELMSRSIYMHIDPELIHEHLYVPIACSSLASCHSHVPIWGGYG